MGQVLSPHIISDLVWTILINEVGPYFYLGRFTNETVLNSKNLFHVLSQLPFLFDVLDYVSDLLNSEFDVIAVWVVLRCVGKQVLINKYESNEDNLLGISAYLENSNIVMNPEDWHVQICYQIQIAASWIR